MATIKRCDRCRSEYQMDPQSTFIGWTTIQKRRWLYPLREATVEFDYDLCPDCTEAFKEWVKGGLR